MSSNLSTTSPPTPKASRITSHDEGKKRMIKEEDGFAKRHKMEDSIEEEKECGDNPIQDRSPSIIMSSNLSTTSPPAPKASRITSHDEGKKRMIKEEDGLAKRHKTEDSIEEEKECGDNPIKELIISNVQQLWRDLQQSVQDNLNAFCKRLIEEADDSVKKVLAEERSKHEKEMEKAHNKVAAQAVTSSSLHSVDKNLRKELLEKEKKDLETEREEKKKIAGPSTAKRLKYIKNRIKDINRQLDTELHARLRERNHLNYLRRLEKKKKHRIIMENSSEDIMSDTIMTQSSHQVVLPTLPP